MDKQSPIVKLRGLEGIRQPRCKKCARTLNLNDTDRCNDCGAGWTVAPVDCLMVERRSNMRTKHPGHKTRFINSSLYTEICERCGAVDAIGGWGLLAEPCHVTKGCLMIWDEKNGT